MKAKKKLVVLGAENILNRDPVVEKVQTVINSIFISALERKPLLY